MIHHGRQSRKDWRDTVSALAIEFSGKLATSLVTGIGIPVGRALAS